MTVQGKVSGISGVAMPKQGGAMQSVVTSGKVLRQTTEIQAIEPENKPEIQKKFRKWAVYSVVGLNPRFLETLDSDSPPTEQTIREVYGDGDYSVRPIDPADNQTPLREYEIPYRIGIKRENNQMSTQVPVPPTAEFASLLIARNAIGNEEKARDLEVERRKREEDERRDEIKRSQALEIEKMKLESDRLRIEAELKREEAEFRRKDEERRTIAEYERKREEREEKARQDKLEIEREKIKQEELYRKRKEEAEEQARKEEIRARAAREEAKLAREEEWQRKVNLQEEQERRDRVKREEERREKEEKEDRERKKLQIERDEREEKERKREREERERIRIEAQEREDKIRRENIDREDRIRREKEEKEYKERKEKEEREEKDRKYREEKEAKDKEAAEKAAKDRFDQLKWGVGLLAPVVKEVTGMIKTRISDNEPRESRSSEVLPVLEYMRERDERREDMERMKKDREEFFEEDRSVDSDEPPAMSVTEMMSAVRMGMDLAKTEKKEDTPIFEKILGYLPMLAQLSGKQQQQQQMPQQQMQQQQQMPQPPRIQHERPRMPEFRLDENEGEEAPAKTEKPRKENKNTMTQEEAEKITLTTVDKILTDPKILVETLKSDPRYARTVLNMVQSNPMELMADLQQAAEIKEEDPLSEFL